MHPELTPATQAPSADGSRLDPDWRTRIPERLDRLIGLTGRDPAWRPGRQA